MAEEKDSIEKLLSRFILIQSRLEYETNALESLILSAKNQAENDNSDLIYILDALQSKAESIKNTVFDTTES